MATSYSQVAGSPVSISIPNGTLDGNLASIFSVFPQSFMQQCQEAMVTVALGVLGYEDSTVPDATSRKNYARLVISNPSTYTPSAAWAIVADGVTGYSSTDQQICDRILAIWDVLSYGD